MSGGSGRTGTKAKGTYKARLGFLGEGFRPGRWFNKHLLPYMLVDGTTIIADSYFDLTDGSLDAMIRLTADGTDLWQTLSSWNVWSDVSAYGEQYTTNCDDWSEDVEDFRGRIGFGEQTDTRWAYGASNQRCLAFARIYCVEQ